MYAFCALRAAEDDRRKGSSSLSEGGVLVNGQAAFQLKIPSMYGMDLRVSGGRKNDGQKHTYRREIGIPHDFL